MHAASEEGEQGGRCGGVVRCMLAGVTVEGMIGVEGSGGRMESGNGEALGRRGLELRVLAEARAIGALGRRGWLLRCVVGGGAVGGGGCVWCGVSTEEMMVTRHVGYGLKASYCELAMIRGEIESVC